MGECANCHAFTDNPAEKEYQYCDECLSTFEEMRRNGVVVEQNPDGSNYIVEVTYTGADKEGGYEDNHIDALARGKHLIEQLGCDGLYIYHSNGSKWPIEKYLRQHPETRTKVINRLSRLPGKSHPGLLSRIQNIFK